MPKGSVKATVASAKPPQDAVVLRYVGAGAWLPRVPARDLTEADVDQLEAASIASRAFMFACVLYEPIDQEAPAAPEET